MDELHQVQILHRRSYEERLVQEEEEQETLVSKVTLEAETAEVGTRERELADKENQERLWQIAQDEEYSKQLISQFETEENGISLGDYQAMDDFHDDSARLPMQTGYLDQLVVDEPWWVAAAREAELEGGMREEERRPADHLYFPNVSFPMLSNGWSWQREQRERLLEIPEPVTMMTATRSQRASASNRLMQRYVRWSEAQRFAFLLCIGSMVAFAISSLCRRDVGT
eukprot:GEMP01040697.1.p1 GENE.GEMP01040697.1~~GEMP01040697.1.p1  ORF type:complete len:235 (+),score=57.78 GEMP01040697.1:27-707(+)